MKPKRQTATMLTNFQSKTERALTNQPIVTLISCLLLSGCTGSTYSTHFDCPMGEGAGCASISKVNKMIDRQEIDLGNDGIPSCKGTCLRQLEGSPTALGNQVYIYYGPDQLSRLISIDGQSIDSQGGN